VCSDIHGRPHVLKAIVAHAGYDADADRLVIAGDLNDDRTGDAEVLVLALSLRAEVLVGNHELWKLDGYRDYEGVDVHSELVVRKLLDHEWDLAAEADGVLITHAGISQLYADRWDLGGLTAAEIARRLNSRARLVALRFANDEPVGDEGDLLELEGPVWYYPGVRPSAWPLDSVRQVTGHRVPGYQVDWSMIAAYEESGFYHVDPGVRVYEYLNERHIHIRYALIEAGEVTIVDEFID
jgi:hypothetical protein